MVHPWFYLSPALLVVGYRHEESNFSDNTATCACLDNLENSANEIELFKLPSWKNLVNIDGPAVVGDG